MKIGLRYICGLGSTQKGRHSLESFVFGRVNTGTSSQVHDVSNNNVHFYVQDYKFHCSL